MAWACRGAYGAACALLIYLCLTPPLPALSQDNTWIETEYTITEENPPNTVVGNLSAHPHFADQPVLGPRQFSFLPSSAQFQQLYTIDSHGILRTNSVIDRDESCARSMKCDMMLDVGVIGPDRTFQLMKVTVHIEDINDNAPAFSSGDTKELSISETALPGVSFVLPQAWDPDSGKFGVQTYQLTTVTDKFVLNVSLGVDGTVDMRLVLLARLDREERARYVLEVVATDGGTPALTGTLTVEVKVRDANDNSPKFQQPSYEVKVREDTPVGDVILQVLASDPDDGPNAEVVYSLTSPTPNANPGLLIFGIRNHTGEVILRKALDYEQQTAYHLLVTAMDKGPDAIPTQARVVIKVVDVNDHPPTIVVNALTATGNAEIPENSEPGVFVAHVSIEDKDSGPSGDVSCVLSSGPFELRQLYRNVYKVIALSSFDTERQSSYILTLACHDSGVPPLRTSKDIHVKILDENDHAPVFTQDVYSATLRENMSIGALVVQVNASDGDSDENARLTYTILGDPTRSFRIGPDSGIVSVNTVLDYEVMHNARFQVVAVDHGDPPRSSTATIVVNIVDVNDCPPLFYLSSYSFSLEENSPPWTEIGAVLATDKDSEPYNDIVYSLSANDPDTEPFEIDPKLGLIISRRVLDREYEPSYTLVVFAGNPGYSKMTSSVQVTILLTDINDNAPTIIFPNNTSNTVNIPYGAPEGFIFAKVVAMDVDAGANAKLNYAIAKTSTQSVFDIDRSSGAVSIKSADLWAAGEVFDVLIIVSDQGTPPKTSSIEMVLRVNKSVVYPGRKDLYPGLDDTSLSRSGRGGVGIGALNQNQTVLISLGIVTLLLVTILIVAIILVRRRKYKGDDDDATSGDGARGQNNFLKVQPSVKSGSGDYVDTDALPESDSQESGVYSEESGERGIKDVKFINNISGGILVKGGPQVTAVSTQAVTDDDSGCYSLNSHTGGIVPNAQENTWQRLQKGQHLQGAAHHTHYHHNHQQHPHHQHHPNEHHQQRHPHQPYQQAELTCHPLVENGGTNAQHKPWALTQKELEVHQLLSRVPNQPPTEQADSDSTSGCSAEVSTTDSGRGPSEDGDHLALPGGNLENKHEDLSDMSHPALSASDAQIGDVVDPRSRTPGRGTRSGTRPPTGTKPGQHGVHSKQAALVLRHPHHPHRQEETRHAPHRAPPHGATHAPSGTPPLGHARTSQGLHHVPGVHAHSHNKQKRWPSPCGSGVASPEARLTVSEQPTRTPGKVKCNPHHAPYRDVRSAAPALGHPTDTNAAAAVTGKMLIWERFREHADGSGRPLPVVPARALGSVQETTQDEMSDDASTTSGSYVLDLDEHAVRHHQPRPVIVGERDSFV